MKPMELSIRVDLAEPSATFTPSGEPDMHESTAAADALVGIIWRGAGWYEVRSGEEEPVWAWFDGRSDLARETFDRTWLAERPTTVWYMGDGEEPEP